MKKPGFRGGQQPEKKLQDAIEKYLRDRGWLVIRTHGSRYQSGLPDIYAAHPCYGARWIEVKRKPKHSFTNAQRKMFPALARVGIGVWIMTEATEFEYLLVVNGPPNWYEYFK